MIDLRRADLHTHTDCSDGRLSPEALVRAVHDHGLQAVAVTDHDTVEGFAAAEEAGRRYGVEVIPGVELSVTVDDEELHLLGYFFDPMHAGLRAHLSAFRTSREERAREMVERLRALGLPLAFEAVAAQAEGGAVGRPHVAAALVEAGLVESYQEAFGAYLKDGGPASVPKPLFAAEDALALLHEAGGIGVLAHPGNWVADRTVMRLIRAGLDGVEVVHPSHDVVLTRYYRRLAREFALLETGGSDYHGFGEHDEERLGRYTIPYPQLERLRARSSKSAVRSAGGL